MGPLGNKGLTRYQFRFLEGGAPDPTLEKDANLQLAQLLPIAPPGATAVGVLEQEGRTYVAAIEVSSPYRSFFEKSVGTSPRSAVNKVLNKIEDRLYKWRFGGGNENTPLPGSNGFNLPQAQG